MFSITHEGEGVEQVAILRNDENGSEVRIAVGMGFNAFSFKVRTESGVADVLYAEEGFPKAGMRVTANGTPILVPFPNRIAGGKFTYDGKNYSLPLNDHGINAIHGFAFDRPWRVVEEEADETWARIVGEFEMLRDSEYTEENWPGNFRVRCEMRWLGNQLIQEFSVKNLSDLPMPFGLGTHPYFRLPIDDSRTLDECYISVFAETVVELEKTIPTGETKPVDMETRLSNTYLFEGSEALQPTLIGSRRFDTVYTGLRSLEPHDEQGYQFTHQLFTETREASPALVTISNDADFPYVVVYTPPHRKAICIEPYTCVTNAVNIGDRLGACGPPTGLWRLEPGEERRATISMYAAFFPKSEQPEE